MRWLTRSKENEQEDKKTMEEWEKLARQAHEEEKKARELADKLMNGHKHDILARKK